jgi:hypothetical protein
MATSEDYLICHEKFVEFAAELAACETAPPPAESGVWTAAESGVWPECVVAAPCPRWLRLPTRGPADPT